MVRVLTPEQIEEKRRAIFDTLTDPTTSHEQKVTYLARKAEDMLTVLDEPEELDALMRCGIDTRCICSLFEGEAPYRPRYICVDFPKFLREGSDYLQLGPAKDFDEALTNLMIFYHNIPSITNYPVYIGDLDKLLDPYITDLTDEEVVKKLKNWLNMIDRTILDSFCHADIGPEATRFGYLLMEAEAQVQNAVPNLTLRVSEDTPDEFLLAAVKCALTTAKPSFANDRMFRGELGDDYCVASCYNGLYQGGGAYTLSRLILSNVAKKADNSEHFKKEVLPHVFDVMARYMDERIRFLVEESGWFENSFLVTEGFVSRDKFSGMFGMVGLAECVNTLLEKDGKQGRFGHDDIANQLGVEIMDLLDGLNKQHFNPYCECTDNHFVLHAQVGIESDQNCSPGTRIPIGEEPDELIDHLQVINLFHKYFPSGTGDIFPVDLTVHKNPQFVMDIIRGAMQMDIRYLSFYGSDSDVIRVTGYLAKRSEIEKLDSGKAVRQNTTALAQGAKDNCKIYQRRIR